MRCKVENCNSIFNERQMFLPPRNSKLLKKWKEILETDENHFFVCEKHFKKNDFEIIKRLKAEAIPSFYLSKDEIKIEKDACGVCLSKQNEKQLSSLTKEMQILVYGLSGYEVHHDQICEECENELNQYQQIKSTIQQKHEQLKSLFEQPTVNTEDFVQNFPSPSDPTNYSCSYCSTFHASNESDLYNHLKSSHGFGCDYCNTNVATFNQLKAHLDLIHEDIQSLTCNECNVGGFAQKSILKLHQEIVHKRRFDLKCSICPKTFLTTQGFNLHKLLRHPPKVHQTSQLPLKIVAAETVTQFSDENFEKKTLTKVRKKITPQRPIPSKIYLDKKILIQKLLENKAVTSTVQSTTEVEQVNFVECDSLKMEPEEEANLESSEFENIFFKEEEKETQEYEIQVIVSEDEKMISEGEEMSSKIDVQKFLKYEPLEKFDKNASLVKCLECNKFLTVEDLLMHRKIHHPKNSREYPRRIRKPKQPIVEQKSPELKIVCEFCFALVNETNLEKHIENYHSNKTKEFLCHICSKDFMEKRSYQRHMRRHDPDQMFKCDLCNKSYVTKVMIKKHIERFHLGIYSHRGQCNICEQKVLEKNYVELHMNKYHKNGYDCGARVNSETNWFDCEKCGATYPDLFTYRRHKCEKGRYQKRCPDCMKPINTIELLKNHQANKCGVAANTSSGIFFRTRYKKIFK